MFKLVTLTLLFASTFTYPTYKPTIPNGYRVPSPCGGGTWNGVGHLLAMGSGPLNPFGVAFSQNGHAWSTALCMMDSDGDGMTNGEELGDPNCRWTVTNGARLQNPKGHPGICEPVGSAQCLASGFTC